MWGWRLISGYSYRLLEKTKTFQPSVTLSCLCFLQNLICVYQHCWTQFRQSQKLQWPIKGVYICTGARLGEIFSENQCITHFTYQWLFMTSNQKEIPKSLANNKMCISNTAQMVVKRGLQCAQTQRDPDSTQPTVESHFLSHISTLHSTFVGIWRTLV